MVNFDFDSAEIRPESYPLLDEFGKAFAGGLRDAVFAVAGHTDSSGSDEYNLRLSCNRGHAVMNYLNWRHYIDSSRLVVECYGENDPIATNTTEEGRQKNRRVEFIRKK